MKDFFGGKIPHYLAVAAFAYALVNGGWSLFDSLKSGERKLKEEQLAAEAEAAEASGPIMKESPEIKEYVTKYYEFAGTFTTNLRASRKFLQVGIGVSTQYDDTVMQNVEMHQLALRSEILGVISEFSEEEIEGKEGRDNLARAIADALNAMLEEIEQFGGIEKVHFTSFMVQ